MLFQRWLLIVAIALCAHSGAEADNGWIRAALWFYVVMALLSVYALERNRVYLEQQEEHFRLLSELLDKHTP